MTSGGKRRGMVSEQSMRGQAYGPCQFKCRGWGRASVKGQGKHAGGVMMDERGVGVGIAAGEGDAG